MTSEPTPRRVLVLVHEFPPAGGAGVQRIAKFCKYLPDFGWSPEVISTEMIEGRPTDPTLVADVGGVPVTRLAHRDVATSIARILSPLKRRGTGSQRGGEAVGTGAAPAARQPLSARIAYWIAVPDGASRWAGSAARTARDPRFAGVEAVLASGPPFSTLVAGARAAKSLGVPFIADMRDPWRDSPSRRTPTPVHRHRQQALERKVMSAAFAVTTTSVPISEEAVSMGARRASAIPNGYDPDDLPPRWLARASVNKRHLALAFMGRFYSSHDPSTALRGIALAREAGIDVTLDVVGPDAPWVRQLAVSLGLSDSVRFLGYKPHTEALEIVARSDVALVTLASVPGTEAIYPGKLFEYLGMGMPTLLVGPVDGVSAQLIAEARAGMSVDPDDPQAVADALALLAEAASADRLPRPDVSVTARFERRALTARLAEVLDAAVAHGGSG